MCENQKDPGTPYAKESAVGAMRRREEMAQSVSRACLRMTDSELNTLSGMLARTVGSATPTSTSSSPIGYSHEGINRAERESQGIGWAVKQMHNGAAVTRRGWNGKGMFLRLQWPDGHSKMTQPYVYMLTADGQRVPWLCSQSDLLATDWDIFLTE